MNWEDWQPISTAPEGVTVETKIDDERGVRNVTKLNRSGKLWFTPDGIMYVYYTPTHWRPVQDQEEEKIAALKRAVSVLKRSQK